MKTVFLVADGMAGWPLDALGGRTSLQAAATPREPHGLPRNSAPCAWQASSTTARP